MLLDPKGEPGAPKKKSNIGIIAGVTVAVIVLITVGKQNRFNIGKNQAHAQAHKQSTRTSKSTTSASTRKSTSTHEQATHTHARTHTHTFTR